jgi:hypothetical protein
MAKVQSRGNGQGATPESDLGIWHFDQRTSFAVDVGAFSHPKDEC